MYRKKIYIKLSAVLMLLFCLSFSFQQLNFWEYQKRGNYYEGTKSKKLSDNDQIELLSMRVDYQESMTPFPDRLALKFYIEQPQRKVHITVREIYDRRHYIMDRVEKSDWQKGWHGNTFMWETSILSSIGLTAPYEQLGVVARLRSPYPDIKEEVAPVCLYFSKPPDKINGYVFIFKTSQDARIGWQVYQEDNSKLVYELPYIRLSAGVPFVFRWDCAKNPAGHYRLVGTGYYKYGNDPFSCHVDFYHQPYVTR